jgi:TonB-dependent starch-binding outer membrane protein SusC
MEKNLGKRLIIFALSILMSLVAFGQQTRVSGTVTDAADGSTLPGVNVTVKGTLTGSITGTNGEYSLMAQPGDVLVFTFIGYLPQEVTLGTQAVVNVAMRTDVQALDEVVVIGYGTVRKEDATGSVKAVNSEYFNPGIVSSPQNMVIGKMAGVQITTGGGAPGDGATIRIRGGSSLNASNDPLIVIDGVAVDIIGVSGMRNPLSTINPNDIETFTVLKDASATAIYGSRASNGVILITTKKGASGKPFSVNYTGSVSVSSPFNYVDVFNADEFRTIINDRYESDPGVTSLLGESDTDWQKEIYRTAISYDNNLNFTGGLGKFPYRVSIGYTDQDGILDTDNLKRVTGSVNISPTLFNDHLKIELNAKGMINNNTFANTGAIGGATSMDPTQATDFVWLDTNGHPDFNATMNPLIQLSDYHDVSDVNRLIGNLMLDYKMHFFPALRAKLNLGLDKSNSEGTVEIPVGSMLDYSNYEGKGRLTEYNEHKTTSLLDFYFDYTGEFGDHSRLNAIAGYSWQHFYRDGMTYTATVTDEVVKADNDYKTESFLVSFFGRINYVLLDRYLFTFTLRDDGSSKFSPENRWGLFPSAAFAWNISKEGFFGDNAVSNLKLRLGYGVTGQQNLTNNDYPYQAIYMFHEPGGYVQFGDRYVQPVRPSGYDANLKWEETATYNIGLDYGFLKDRITGDIDVYLRKTSDLINEIPVPAGTNLSNRIVTNVGNLENRGIEFSINAKAVAATNVDWEIGFNATYNENKITKLTVVDDPDYQGIYTGGIGGGTGNTIQIHSVGYPQSSFFVMEQVYGADGKPIENLYVDNDNSGTITTSDDKYRYKKPAPDVFMGFSSLFRYKNLDFSFNGRINVGNYVYNNINSGLGTYAYMAATGRYLNNRVRNVEYTNFENPQYWSDYYIENASFLKLDNASLGYNFNNLLNDKLDLRVYCTAENLFTVTKYTGLDPEIFSGIDNNLYPRPRTFMFGISLTL